jgi:hypothetical protein
MFESGRVFLPAEAPWLNDYIDELASFPAGVHDDMVDSTTQALNYLRSAADSEPPPFIASEPLFSIAGLRRMLSDEPQRFVHPDFGRAIVDGRGLEDVSEEQLDDFLFGPENLGH